MQLTQKETGLLKDLKSQEKLCVEKYSNYAAKAIDPQLQSLLSQIGQIEQHHLDCVLQIESGSVPNGSSGITPPKSFSSVYPISDSQDKKNDCYLCSDLLTTEKHVSHLYDTCIFEFKQEDLRNVLNVIQTEEQGHGKMIYDYMSANNMYG